MLGACCTARCAANIRFSDPSSAANCCCSSADVTGLPASIPGRTLCSTLATTRADLQTSQDLNGRGGRCMWSWLGKLGCLRTQQARPCTQKNAAAQVIRQQRRKMGAACCGVLTMKCRPAPGCLPRPRRGRRPEASAGPSASTKRLESTKIVYTASASSMCRYLGMVRKWSAVRGEMTAHARRCQPVGRSSRAIFERRITT